MGLFGGSLKVRWRFLLVLFEVGWISWCDSDSWSESSFFMLMKLLLSFFLELWNCRILLILLFFFVVLYKDVLNSWNLSFFNFESFEDGKLDRNSWSGFMDGEIVEEKFLMLFMFFILFFLCKDFVLLLS